jgi:hypothetical protein
VAIWIQRPRSLDVEPNNFNELPDKFKAAGAAFCARFRERGAAPHLRADRGADALAPSGAEPR